MAWLAATMDLTTGEALFALAAAFCAGVVRGFAGFALSALVMASVVAILPPAALIPICIVLEGAATVLMARGGMRGGDRPMAARLTAGVVVGTPLGLAMTTSLPVESSRMVALAVILALAMLQLGRMRIPGVDSPAGTYAAGAVSGVAGGLAAVGGMVVALFVLAQRAPAGRMRATLVLYLAAMVVVGAAWLVWFDLMTWLAVARGAALTVPAMLGVVVGMRIFTPRYERFYRPFCLALLIALAGIGLARTAM